MQPLAAKGLNQAPPQSGTAHHLFCWHEIWVRVECWQHLLPAHSLLHGLPVSNHAALSTALNTYGWQKALFSTALSPNREVSSSHARRYACRACQLPALACAHSSSHRWARIAPDHIAHVAPFSWRKHCKFQNFQLQNYFSHPTNVRLLTLCIAIPQGQSSGPEVCTY